jgi:tetratricopeptide (TPR) repeat protein
MFLRHRLVADCSVQGVFVRSLPMMMLGLLVAVPPAGAQAPPASAPAPPAATLALREPTIAPAPDWIEPVAMAAPDPALRDRAAQMLLLANQTWYGPDHHDYFIESAVLIQTMQGLQGFGSITLPWRPEQTDLIVHKVQIIRNGTVIDLLAAGRRFTVLRRESNLESAMLDGVLTAVLQAEGLAVGDVIHLSFTLRRRAGALPLRGENFMVPPSAMPPRRLYSRQIWPQNTPMRWRGTGALERAVRVRRTRLGTELVLDITGFQPTPPPAQAPVRFLLPETLQLSEYRDWAEVGAVLAPHYDRAATLAATSPLRERIARIAAATADPRARAMAALRLVQDEVRYFAVVIGDGNYLPASAEETWARRYGDCKGKTVLLLALLRGLGIEAEAMAVHSILGDALGESLPQLALFDHVLVRARIDGRSHWLDGTRTGDRDIEALASSSLSWGLPLRAAGAELERLPYGSVRLPTVETRVTYDASEGFLGSVRVTGETLFRGDEASAMRMVLGQSGAEAFREFARTYANSQLDSTPAEVSHEDNVEAGTFTLRYSGTRQMTWTGSASSRVITFRFDNDVLSWEPDFSRPAGAPADVPFQLSVPTYQLYTETLILPRGGEGFRMVGANIDRTVAGVHFSRTLTLENGRAIARSGTRQVLREISAAEARASAPALAEIRNDRAQVTGSTIATTATDRAALQGVEPSTAQTFVARGYRRLQDMDLDGATADFDRAATLNPTWSRPLANRGVIEVHRRKYEEAEAFFGRASALDPNDFVIHQGRGMIELGRNRPIQAVVALSRAVELAPENPFNLRQRSRAYEQLGAFDDALADLDAALQREPGHPATSMAKARILAWRNQPEPAIAALDAMVARDPRNPIFLASQARVLRQLGRTQAAASAFSEALAIVDARIAQVPREADELNELRIDILAQSGDSAGAARAIDAVLVRQRTPLRLNQSCWTRATANIELERALANCEEAVRRAPTNAAILDSRAFVKLRLGQIDGAITDASAALAIDPRHSASLYVRGLARLRKGEREAGERDLAAARAMVFDIDATYRAYGVAPATGVPAVPAN